MDIRSAVAAAVILIILLIVVLGNVSAQRKAAPDAHAPITIMPAYCNSRAAERLPECGWDETSVLPAEPYREDRRKLSDAEIHEMARIFTNCMKTDKTQEQCAKQAGVPLSAFPPR